MISLKIIQRKVFKRLFIRSYLKAVSETEIFKISLNHKRDKAEQT